MGRTVNRKKIFECLYPRLLYTRRYTTLVTFLIPPDIVPSVSGDDYARYETRYRHSSEDLIAALLPAVIFA
jgi:hypothetical protein